MIEKQLLNKSIGDLKFSEYTSQKKQRLRESGVHN